MKNINFKNLTSEQKNNLWLAFLGICIITFVFVMPKIYSVTHKNDVDYTNSSNSSNVSKNNNKQNNNNTNNTENNKQDNTNTDTDTNTEENSKDISEPIINNTIPKSYTCKEVNTEGHTNKTIVKTYKIENKLLKEVKTVTTLKYEDETLYNIEKEIFKGVNNDEAKTIVTEVTNDYLTEKITNYDMPEDYLELKNYLTNNGKSCTVNY